MAVPKSQRAKTPLTVLIELDTLISYTIQLCTVPASRGFKWLGYRIRQTPTGKIIMTLDKKKIVHERRKLKRMVRLVKLGKLPKETPDHSLESWASHAAHGNNHRIICKMKTYYKSLWRD